MAGVDAERIAAIVKDLMKPIKDPSRMTTEEWEEFRRAQAAQYAATPERRAQVRAAQARYRERLRRRRS